MSTVFFIMEFELIAGKTTKVVRRAVLMGFHGISVIRSKYISGIRTNVEHMEAIV